MNNAGWGVIGDHPFAGPHARVSIGAFTAIAHRYGFRLAAIIDDHRHLSCGGEVTGRGIDRSHAEADALTWLEPTFLRAYFGIGLVREECDVAIDDQSVLGVVRTRRIDGREHRVGGIHDRCGSDEQCNADAQHHTKPECWNSLSHRPSTTSRSSTSTARR